jgi:dolichol-phosphate mannosyltransferase
MNDTIVVIPTYNEAGSIGALLDDLAAYDYRAVVVDDSPGPETVEAARMRKAVIIWRSRRGGLGTAIIAGIQRAQSLGATYAVVMDAGGTHRAYDVMRLEAKARNEHVDVVIGSRFKDGYAWQGWRTALSRLATWLVAYGLGVWVTDATCGFRCYRINDRLLEALERTRATGHAFQFELLTYLARDGATIGEVGIPYRLVGKTSLRLKTVVEAALAWCRLAAGK